MRHIFLSFLAGVIFGIGSIIIKILIEDTDIMFLFLNPIFLFIIATGGLGFVLFQKSLIKEKSSHVSLVSTSTMTVISIIGGFLLGEVVGLIEFLGILMITLSTMILLSKNL